MLVGFGGDGAFKYAMSDEKLEELLIRNYPSRIPYNRNTGERLLTEFHIIYNVFRVLEVSTPITMMKSTTWAMQCNLMYCKSDPYQTTVYIGTNQ